MSARRVVVALGVALSVAALAACGGGSSASMTAAASRALAAQDQRVHMAIAGGDPVESAAAIAALREVASSLEQRGEITPGRATSILSAADAVEADLALLPTTTTTTTTPPPTHPDHKPGPDKKAAGD